VKNAGSQAAQVVRRLKARHRLCLTGTPLENHLGELWAQFDFLLPGFLGDEILHPHLAHAHREARRH
jgi:SNF2 family DNA or RNA helicase